jgi:hypothetical protein
MNDWQIKFLDKLACGHSLKSATAAVQLAPSVVNRARLASPTFAAAVHHHHALGLLLITETRSCRLAT